MRLDDFEGDDGVARTRAPDGNPDDEPYRRLAAMVTAAREAFPRDRAKKVASASAFASEVPGRRPPKPAPSPPPNQPPGSRSQSLPSSPFASSSRPGHDPSRASRSLPATPAATAVHPQFFRGVVAFFARDVREPRRSIFSRRLRERGATVVDDASSREMTHAITSDATLALPESAGADAGAGFPATVCPDWASECLKRGEIAPTEAFPPSAASVGAPKGGPNKGALAAARAVRENALSAAGPSRRGEEEGGGDASGDAAAFFASAAGAADAAAGGSSNDAPSGLYGPGGWLALPDSETETRPYLGRVKSKLACQLPSTTHAPWNPNERVTAPMEELADIYEHVLGGVDKYKAKNHRTIAGRIKELNFRVEDVSQLAGHPVTGKPVHPAFERADSSVRDKVRELLATGKMQKLEALKREPRVRGILDLTRVHGIGTEIARGLYQRGFHSVADLRDKVEAEERARGTSDVLTPTQRVGLRHVEDFEVKMPRAEAEAIAAYVREAAEAACPRCQVTVAGSFRRGKATCGDVDVLVAPTDDFMRLGSQGLGGVDRIEHILPRVLRTLRRRGVLTDDLAVSDMSYMGVARLPENLRSLDAEENEDAQGNEDAEGNSIAVAAPRHLHRRVDIKVYRPEEYPFALLYFTGSGYFNRSMRWWAQTKFGLSLNDKGLARCAGNPDAKVEGHFREERDIFEHLKLAYVAPEDRSV